MNTLLRKLIIAGGLLSLYPLTAQVSPTTPKARRIRIIQGPEPESATDYLTIIRWTTNNPGGSPVHYGIVHYGTDPKNLNQTAKNPIRLNPTHDSTVFRVRIEGLKLGKTYYYTVESEESNGANDNVKSGLKQFKVGPVPRPGG
jgi:hypothetical protein